MTLRMTLPRWSRRFLVVATTLITSHVAAQQSAAPSPLVPSYVPAGQSLKYEADVQKFLEADRTTPPPTDGILFIGSSIFRQWEQLSEQMAPLPVFNRAFGGSRTWELLHYMDQIVIPYRPRFVVYYCGSNDVNSKQDASGIATRVAAFFDRVHVALPKTQTFFVTIQRSPDKRARWAVVDSANALVAQYVTRHSFAHSIDLNPVLVDATGNVRGALYRPDSLHFVPSTYNEFAAVIKPVLERAWAKR